MDTYWHFAACDGDGVPRLGYDDGREIRVGETLTVEGAPVLCEHGLHASRNILSALQYTRSDRLSLCRVTLGGTVVHDNDKSVASERTVIAMLDAEATDKLLRQFARWCALQVIHLWDAPDVTRHYLETGDESLRAAARDAAGDTAWDAVRGAARVAARAAARDTAWAAARDAAGAAAWGAARDAQDARLTEMALVAMQPQPGQEGEGDEYKTLRCLICGGEMQRRECHMCHGKGRRFVGMDFSDYRRCPDCAGEGYYHECHEPGDHLERAQQPQPGQEGDE